MIVGMPAAAAACSPRAARPARSRSARSGSAATHPVSVQSMTTTLTADVNATLQQIAELTAAGCDIVRVAVPDAGRRRRAARRSHASPDPGDRRHPLPAQVRLRRDRGRLRGGAGQPRQHQEVRRPGRPRSPGPPRTPASPIRIGVNAGSLDKRMLDKYGKATPEALVESALWEASLFEEHDFHDFKISVKHHDPVIMVARLRAARRAMRLPAAPRGHRGRAGVPGHHQVGDRVRGVAQPGNRGHHPGLAVRAAGGGGQGRHCRSWSR